MGLDDGLELPVALRVGEVGRQVLSLDAEEHPQVVQQTDHQGGSAPVHAEDADGRRHDGGECSVMPGLPGGARSG